MNDDPKKNGPTQRGAEAKKWSRENEQQKPPMTKAEVRTADRAKQQNPDGGTLRPNPSEQDSASLAQEQQRSTGVSGHSGGT
ncbi:MAG: hypothetical protein ABIZ49_13630 [Opitutaceae bacterium]